MQINKLEQKRMEVKLNEVIVGLLICHYKNKYLKCTKQKNINKEKSTLLFKNKNSSRAIEVIDEDD